MKDAKPEVQNTEESSDSDVSVPSSIDQSTQKEMFDDQNSVLGECELGNSGDVLDISGDMHYLFGEPENYGFQSSNKTKNIEEDQECVSPSQSNTSIRSFMKRLKKSTSARLAHKARKIIHRVARSVLTSPLLRRRS